MTTTLSNRAPIAVGGVGGSGTRVVASLLQAGGVHLGPDLNTALDSQIFSLFFKRTEIWPPEQHLTEIGSSIDCFLNGLLAQRPWTTDEENFIRGLAVRPRPNLPREWLEWRAKVLLDQKIRSKPVRWGWKEPNTHIVVPLLLERIPGLKYIHVMRHGLDMAFSQNQEQLLYWGTALLNLTQLVSNPGYSFAYWCAVQSRILSIAKAHPGRVLILRFEDLCTNPAHNLGRIMSFSGLSPTPAELEHMASIVSQPGTVGRFRDQDCSWLTDHQAKLLISLGYDLPADE